MEKTGKPSSGQKLRRNMINKARTVSMKKLILIFLLPFITNPTFSQLKDTSFYIGLNIAPYFLTQLNFLYHMNYNITHKTVSATLCVLQMISCFILSVTKALKLMSRRIQ